MVYVCNQSDCIIKNPLSELKGMARKRIYHGCEGQIENLSLRITVRHHLANLVMPDSNPHDVFFYLPLGAVWSGSTLFAYMQKVCLKSLQEDAADDINRQHFQMQVFLVF